jgi:hypothetical protein
VNSTLANFETMKRVRVVADEWALDTGELTPSMKLKRRVITERYAELIAGLYADEATAHAAIRLDHVVTKGPAFGPEALEGLEKGRAPGADHEQ